MEGGYRGREVSDRPGDNKGSLVLVCIEVNMQQGEDMQKISARCLMLRPLNTLGTTLFYWQTLDMVQKRGGGSPPCPKFLVKILKNSLFSFFISKICFFSHN